MAGQSLAADTRKRVSRYRLLESPKTRNSKPECLTPDPNTESKNYETFEEYRQEETKTKQR